MVIYKRTADHAAGYGVSEDPVPRHAIDVHELFHGLCFSGLRQGKYFTLPRRYALGRVQYTDAVCAELHNRYVRHSLVAGVRGYTDGNAVAVCVSQVYE